VSEPQLDRIYSVRLSGAGFIGARVPRGFPPVIAPSSGKATWSLPLNGPSGLRVSEHQSDRIYSVRLSGANDEVMV